jgi:hypothetical protein
LYWKKQKSRSLIKRTATFYIPLAYLKQFAAGLGRVIILVGKCAKTLNVRGLNSYFHRVQRERYHQSKKKTTR